MATAATAEGALEAFGRGLEAHDTEALLDAYADDAVVVAYSERNRPSLGEWLEGRAAIEGWIRDFMSRNLTHTIGDEVVAGERFACTETCDYRPEGR